MSLWIRCLSGLTSMGASTSPTLVCCTSTGVRRLLRRIMRGRYTCMCTHMSIHTCIFHMSVQMSAYMYVQISSSKCHPAQRGLDDRRPSTLGTVNLHPFLLCPASISFILKFKPEAVITMMPCQIGLGAALCGSRGSCGFDRLHRHPQCGLRCSAQLSDAAGLRFPNVWKCACIFA